jgi:hypothetical protein
MQREPAAKRAFMIHCCSRGRIDLASFELFYKDLLA